MEDKTFTNKCPVWSRVTNKSDGKMYGILLESIQFYVVRDVGQDTWHKILEHAGIKNMIFTTHDTYNDEVMISLAKSCCHVTKTLDFNGWMAFFGTCFVDFCSGYGYDKLLRVSGRNYRDFLHGIDNIHEIIRFSYPHLQSPSFLVMSEDTEGCVLLYQSKRHGFKYYVKGQLQQCAKKFYNVTVAITIIEEVIVEGRTHVKFRLDFDNTVYIPVTVPQNISGKQQFSSISGDRFLQVFPFCIVFNSQLIITSVGPSMVAFIKGDNLVGSCLREKFLICRPLIPCIWSKILRFQGVIFELEYINDADSDTETTDFDNEPDITGIHPRSATRSERNVEERILLRGEMKYITEWDRVAFLCTPLLNNMNDLLSKGLFINDLNMFDMSRDMVMAGWQHASQLERSIEKQRGESEIISSNMAEFEEWRKKSNSLLYSMIPQSIADRLKSGEPPISTCEVFDNVTIMFNYMVGFADICANSRPMEIVKCINDVFILFDKIVDRYNVFKVETLGDAVYMVAGGVPDRSPDHAVSVAGLALELQEKSKSLLDPISVALNTRIGMHTGSVVGGVVGRRMPQYCLFGDTVNTASRMQTYSMPGRIHLSEPCYECLKDSDFVTVVRGTVNIKGKGEMKTYWLAGKAGEASTNAFLEEIKKENAVLKQSSYETALDLHGMHASTSSAQFSVDFGLRKTRTVNTFQKHLPVQRFRQSSISDSMEVTNKEQEEINDDIKAYLDVPTISICESPSFEIVHNADDNASENSVSFFLNTDDCFTKVETKTEDPVAADDITLEEPAVPEVPTECLHASDPEPDSSAACPDFPSDSFVSDETGISDENICVKFPGCPLFSSLFNGNALRCTSCTYSKAKSDDIETYERTEKNKQNCNPSTSADSHSPQINQVITNYVKQPSVSNALSSVMRLKSDIDLPETVNTYSSNDIKTVIKTSRPSNSCADTADSPGNEHVAKEDRHCAMRNTTDLIDAISNDIRETEVTDHISLSETFKTISLNSIANPDSCINTVPSDETGDGSDRKLCSNECQVVMSCPATSSYQTHTNEFMSSQSSSEMSECPVTMVSQTTCPHSHTNQMLTLNPPQTETVPRNQTKEIDPACTQAVLSKEVKFQPEFISCQNGRCLVNGNPLSKLAINKLNCRPSSKETKLCPVSFYLESAEMDLTKTVNNTGACAKKASSLENDEKEIFTNGIDHHPDIPNGSPHEYDMHNCIESQCVGHPGSVVHDKNCNTFNKSLSAPYRHIQTQYECPNNTHRCSSDPGLLSDKDKSKHVGKVESKV